jgi:hypothetical protein
VVVVVNGAVVRRGGAWLRHGPSRPAACVFAAR